MPGLDGLRAVAVLGVLAYHLGADWIPGGLLGVGVFFTLSGYLITDLLLAAVDRGGIKLGQFWLARARRLLPAVILLVIVVMAWVTVVGLHQPSDFRVSAASALGYVNNWWLSSTTSPTSSSSGRPTAQPPLVALGRRAVLHPRPFMLIAGVRFIPELEHAGVRPRLAVATLGLALVSVVLMVVLYDPGIDPSRVYYGTDTRAQELLIGAALAMVWPSRRLHAQIDGAGKADNRREGVVGLAVIGLMFWRSSEFSPFLYRGGFVVLSVATVLVVAASPIRRHGSGRSWAARRAGIGQRSYDHLWHFPIIVLTTPAGGENRSASERAQLAATIGGRRAVAGSTSRIRSATARSSAARPAAW